MSTATTAPAATADTRGPDDVVRIRGLSVRYGEATVLDGVDLRVRPGEVVGLLGHSGSGKSTLMKAMTGMAPAAAEELTVVGRDARGLRGSALRALRSRVGHVFQHFDLVPQLSALTNVLGGGLHAAGPASVVGVFPRALRVRALGLLDRVGLPDRARQRASTLSGGEKQRVAIARALMQEPELILADEPVASLDPRLAASVLDLLAALARERGIPVVVSLHVVALARSFTDRMVGLRDGRVVIDVPAARFTDADVRSVYGTASEFGELRP